MTGYEIRGSVSMCCRMLHSRMFHGWGVRLPCCAPPEVSVTGNPNIRSHLPGSLHQSPGFLFVFREHRKKNF